MTRQTRAQIRAEQLVELEAAEASRKETQRAYAKATVRQLLAVKRRIGVELSEACGADTAEAIEALACVLRDRGVIQVLAERAGLDRRPAERVSGLSSAESVAETVDAEQEWLALSLAVRADTEGNDNDA